MAIAGALHSLLAQSAGGLGVFFAGFAKTAAPVAIDALWQGALVAVALVLCLRFAPRVSASHRFLLWTSAFAVVAVLPLFPILVHSLRSAAAQSVAGARPWFVLDSRWALAVAGLWLMASAFRAADLAFHSLRLRKLWRAAVPVQVDPSLRSMLANVFGARRAIEICTTQELDRPGVIGFLAPRILIPGWLFERLSPGELEHIVLHEVEHLKRRDDWTNLLQKLFLVLFPLNPALVWMERRLCREREMACDEGVVHQTRAPREYAACLTSLAERALKRRTQVLSLGAFGRRPELVHRVHSILWRKRAMHPLAARAWLGALGCGLLFGAVEMARCPQMVGFVRADAVGSPHAVAIAKAASPAPAITRASSIPARHTETASALEGSRAASEMNATSPFRAINTKAIMGRRGNEAEPAGEPMIAASEFLDREQSSRAVKQNARGFELSGTPRQALLKAETPDSGLAEASKPQMIFFLTTWQQVEVLPGKRTAVADYDTGVGDQQNEAAAASRPEVQQKSTITITRMILTVYPMAPLAQAKTRHAANSDSGEPAAVPFEGGWLVFEL
jgi:beta-lactamase regulating signal transducer with metallopeptidase domain